MRHCRFTELHGFVMSTESTADELPKQYDHAAAQNALVPVLERARLLSQRARPEPQAVHDRHPAAERDRRPAPGARAEQHAARHPDPLAADAGLQRPLDAGHRSRRHRHAGRGRAAAAAKKKKTRATIWAARSSSSASGQWKDEYETRILGQLKQMGCSCDWQRTRFTLDDSVPGPCGTRSFGCSKTA